MPDLELEELVVGRGIARRRGARDAPQCRGARRQAASGAVAPPPTRIRTPFRNNQQQFVSWPPRNIAQSPAVAPRVCSMDKPIWISPAINPWMSPGISPGINPGINPAVPG